MWIVNSTHSGGVQTHTSQQTRCVGHPRVTWATRPKRDGALGGFIEQELLDIPVIYTPNVGGEGHWSVPVDQTTASQYEERFSEAAKRIKAQDPNRFPRNPNY